MNYTCGYYACSHKFIKMNYTYRVAMWFNKGGVLQFHLTPHTVFRWALPFPFFAISSVLFRSWRLEETAREPTSMESNRNEHLGNDGISFTARLNDNKMAIGRAHTMDIHGHLQTNETLGIGCFKDPEAHQALPLSYSKHPNHWMTTLTKVTLSYHPFWLG